MASITTENGTETFDDILHIMSHLPELGTPKPEGVVLDLTLTADLDGATNKNIVRYRVNDPNRSPNVKLRAHLLQNTGTMFPQKPLRNGVEYVTDWLSHDSLPTPFVLVVYFSHSKHVFWKASHLITL